MHLLLLTLLVLEAFSVAEGRRNKRFKKKGDAQVPLEQGPDPWAIRKAEFSRRHSRLMAQLDDRLLDPLNRLMQADNGHPLRNPRPNVKWTPIPVSRLWSPDLITLVQSP